MENGKETADTNTRNVNVNSNLLRYKMRRKMRGIAKVTELAVSKNAPAKKTGFQKDDGFRVEERLQLPHLEQLMHWFQNHRPASVVTKESQFSKAKKQYRQPGLLSAEEFKDIIVKVLGTHDYDDQLDTLFTKLDTSCDGYVDWNEFTTYMLLQFRENDYMRAKKQIPFPNEAKIRHIVHNRQETTTKILSVDGPTKYVTISKEGAICVWDTLLHLERHYNMTESEEDPRAVKRRIREWVTDAVYMPNCRKIAIASTGRDIRFFDTTTADQWFAEYHLYALPDVPTCLTYYYDKKNPGNQSSLMFGNEKGQIYVFYFNKPITQLFATPYKKDQGVSQIYFPDFQDQAAWVRYIRLDDIHPESIKKMIYMPENDCIISSSASARSSLVVMDVMRRKKTYIYKLLKGVECFDYNKHVNILVTGGADHLVRIWNPYVTSKPTAILEGHAMGIIDVVIHQGLRQVFSYSRDTVLKIWDVKEHVCLQTTMIKYPSSLLGRMPEYGPFSMHLQGSPNCLLLAANDYIAQLKVGESATPVSLVPTTHLTQLCSAIYNPFFKQVVTGADDSTVGVWDVETGAKSMLFANAHGQEEITCMAFDSGWRRLMTGARNGSIKVWNIQNGHNLHQLEAVQEAEVTGIVPMPDKKIILSVGWSRMITQYDDNDPDNLHVKANNDWKGGQVHQEDILAVSYSAPNLLATASFDGEINVWSMETESLYMKLRKASKPTNRFPLLAGMGSARSHHLAGSGNSSHHSSSRTEDTGFILPPELSRSPTVPVMVTGPPPSTPGNSRPGSHQSSISRARSAPSRPNSRHRRTHKPPRGQNAPVDKLLFLNGRVAVKKRHEGAILLSSEAGTIRWWSIYGKKRELGNYYAPDGVEESVLGLCTDPANSILVTGDTQGRVIIWNIEKHCLEQQLHRVTSRPELIRSWIAHDSALVSVEYVEHELGVFLLTASTDRTAKLWTIEGKCVGVFGQKHHWNLKQPSTWADAPAKSTEVKIEEKSPETNEEKNSIVEEAPEAEEEEAIPEIDRGETLIDDMSVSRPTKGVKAFSVGPVGQRTAPLVGDVYGKRAQTCTYGIRGIDVTDKSLLGSRVEQELAKKTRNRQERRGFREVDMSNTNPYGRLCCPFKALATPDLNDIELPADLPLTPRMMNRGYTSASLTVDGLKNMNLSYNYSNDPPLGGETKPHKLPALKKARTQIGGFRKAPKSAKPIAASTS